MSRHALAFADSLTHNMWWIQARACALGSHEIAPNSV